MALLERWVDNRIVQNLLVWLFFFLVLMTTIQTENKVLTSFFAILLLVPAVYVNNLFILPYFKKRLAVFMGLFIANTLLFTVISVFLIGRAIQQPFEGRMFVNFLGIMVLVLIFASTLKMTRDSFIRRQQVQDAELKLLKAQLNPHFLFNTLNNLYGLSVAKSDKLPELMLKLSNLLRYSLYETKDALVPLEKEIFYLENYMALEKIRLEDQTAIVFENKVTDTKTMIAPMLLIVFVENAFKHLHVSADSESRVFVSLEEKGGKLFFRCINTFHDANSSYDHQLESGKSGIGLRNVKKRLGLIYPDKHKLDIRTKKKEHDVALVLYKID